MHRTVTSDGSARWLASMVVAVVTAAGALGAPSVVDAVTPAGDITGIYLDGSPDEPILAGRQLLVTTTNGGIQPYPGTPPPATETVLFQFGLSAGGYGGVYLQAPSGQNLAVGAYEGAVDRTLRDASHPGLTLYWVDGLSAVCTASGGRFDVLQVIYDGDALVSFAARIETTCVGEWWPAPATLYAEVRWQSSIALHADQVSPVPLTFATRNTSTVSSPTTVTVTNVGTAPLNVASVTIAGANPGEFSIASQTCTGGSPIAAGGSCTAGVRFQPTVVGDRVADLVIDDDTFRGSQVVRMTGTATVPVVDADATPAELAFGGYPVGTTSPGLTATLTNTGTLPVVVTTVTITGPASSDFAVADETCTAAPVAVGGACQATVTLTPSDGGPVVASLVFDDDSAAGSHSLSLSGSGVRPPSGVSWTAASKVGPAYTWNAGGALGRTVSSGTQRFHAAYATDRVAGSWATDSGPHAGVYYVGSSSGATWTTPKRLNPSTQHALRLGLAAAGSRVYVTWVSQTRLIKYSPTAPRVLYVRVNSGAGAPSSWKSTIRLTSTSGRVDYPTIAATGYDVYVAWTNSNTGDIRLAYSRDRGATWHQSVVGTTSSSTTSGKTGFPSVAANGATVAVSWLANGSGAIKTRISTNRGGSWGPTATVTTGSNGTLSTAVAGSRVAVAWTTADDTVLRMATNGTWHAPRLVASLAPGTAPMPYGPVVLLQGTDRVGLAWSAQKNSSGSWSDLLWAESADNGSSWFATQVLASASTTSSRRLNDWPSVSWPAAGTRYVLWNGWTSGTTSYRQFIRKGSGTPIGPTSAAAVWSGDVSAGTVGAAAGGGARTDSGSRRGSGSAISTTMK